MVRNSVVAHMVRSGGSKTFTVRATGRSMEPRFLDGDIVIVDPDAASGHGDFILVDPIDGDDAVLRRLVIDIRGNRYVETLNSSQCTRITPLRDDDWLVGRVIFHQKETF